MNIIEQFKTALYRFKSYPTLLLVKWWKVIAYVIMLAVIATLISSIGFRADFENLAYRLEAWIPEFTYKDGKLESEPVDYHNEQASLLVHIDTKANAADYDIGNYKFGYVVDSENVILINGGESSSYKLSAIVAMPMLDRAMLLDTLHSRGTRAALYLMSVLFLFMVQLLDITNQIVIVTVAGCLINSFIVRSQLRLGSILKLCCYCVTFPVLLMSIVSIFGSSISYLSIGIAGAYCYLALKNVRSSSGIVLATLGEREE